MYRFGLMFQVPGALFQSTTPRNIQVIIIQQSFVRLAMDPFRIHATIAYETLLRNIVTGCNPFEK